MKRVDPRRVMQSVGRRVAEERIRLDLTQADLAERMDVSVKYVQRIEWGRENLTITSLVALANLLGVDPLKLLKPARTKKPRPGRPRIRGGSTTRRAIAEK